MDGSTGAGRVTVVGQLLGSEGEYGVATLLSREIGVVASATAQRQIVHAQHAGSVGTFGHIVIQQA